jgi:hypothetical protein
MPATCPNCGREIGRRDKFCDVCGAFLGWDAGESADSQLFPQRASQEDDQRASVRIEIRNDLIEVAPGNAESTAFTIKNLGTQVERFGFSLTGPDWLVVEPATVVVYPGDEATGTVQAAPPRKPGSVAGVTPFRLTVTSALHTHVSSSVAGRVNVAPYYELAAELIPTSSNGRGLTRHHITLDNRSNVPLRIGLNPTDVADGLRLGVPAFADVAPGQVVEVPVTVYGTRRWFGRPEPKTFSVISEPPKPLAAARLSGTRIVAPLFPRWVPAAAAGLVAVAVAAAVVVPKLTANGTVVPPPSSSSSSAQSSAASSSSAATASSAASSATSASASASQVPVPAVAGDTLQQADTALDAVHLVADHQASYDSSSPEGTNVVGTNPAAGTVVPAGSTVHVLVPIQSYEMIAVAAQAEWTATSQLTPPSATLPVGMLTGTAGNVFVLTSATLEDGTVASQALETRPPPVQNGTITGKYKLPGPTMDQEDFRADIGFVQGTPANQMIQYQVVAVAGGSTTVLLSGTHTSGSGQVPALERGLPTGTTTVELVVTTLDSAPGKDDILWVNPRIVEMNAPQEPPRPTASASPPPPSSSSP